MNLIRTAAPAQLPVTLDEVKQHARIDEVITDQDPTLSGLVQAATQHLDGIDGYLGRALITQSWRLVLPKFPAGRDLVLPLPRLISVDSVTYEVSGSPTVETLAASSYGVDTGTEPGRIVLNSGANWPTTRTAFDAVKVDYTAGYGPNMADVPQPIRQAIAILAGYYYDFRYPIVTGTIVAELPFHVRALIDNYRILSF